MKRISIKERQRRISQGLKLAWRRRKEKVMWIELREVFTGKTLFVKPGRIEAMIENIERPGSVIYLSGGEKLHVRESTSVIQTRMKRFV